MYILTYSDNYKFDSFNSIKYFKEYISKVKKTNKFNVYMSKYSNLGNSLLKHNKNADAIRLKINIITVKYYVI